MDELKYLIDCGLDENTAEELLNFWKELLGMYILSYMTSFHS
jgi:hypothetical protein